MDVNIQTNTSHNNGRASLPQMDKFSIVTGNEKEIIELKLSMFYSKIIPYPIYIVLIDLRKKLYSVCREIIIKLLQNYGWVVTWEEELTNIGKKMDVR